MNALLDALRYIGETLDKPGAAVRGLAAGRPSQLANLIPFSDALGWTDPTQRSSGRDVLEHWGALGPNQEGLDWGDVAGFGTEFALDPLNWIGLGMMGRTAKAAGATRAFNASEIEAALANNLRREQILKAGGMPQEVAELTKAVDASGQPQRFFTPAHATEYPLELQHQGVLKPYYDTGGAFSPDPQWANRELRDAYVDTLRPIRADARRESQRAMNELLAAEDVKRFVNEGLSAEEAVHRQQYLGGPGGPAPEDLRRFAEGVAQERQNALAGIAPPSAAETLYGWDASSLPSATRPLRDRARRTYLDWKAIPRRPAEYIEQSLLDIRNPFDLGGEYTLSTVPDPLRKTFTRITSDPSARLGGQDLYAALARSQGVSDARDVLRSAGYDAINAVDDVTGLPITTPLFHTPRVSDQVYKPWVAPREMPLPPLMPIPRQSPLIAAMAGQNALSPWGRY